MVISVLAMGVSVAVDTAAQVQGDLTPSGDAALVALELVRRRVIPPLGQSEHCRDRSTPVSGLRGGGDLASMAPASAAGRPKRHDHGMRAVVHHRYGPADRVLTVEEIDRPTPRDNDVLVRIRAASMHPDVWHVVEGVPLALRLFGNGLVRPTRHVPGTDLAGRVEAVGSNVARFSVGDDVFGESALFGWWNGGAYAEYAAVPEEYLALKPANITFGRPPSSPRRVSSR